MNENTRRSVLKYHNDRDMTMDQQVWIVKYKLPRMKDRYRVFQTQKKAAEFMVTMEERHPELIEAVMEVTV